MALAVPVVLAVRLVVLVVVRHEVAQREPVVRGDEVDARARPAPAVLVQVGGAGEPGGELAERAGLGPPEVPYGVPVLAVPLRPQGREVAHLVAALAHVPRLGDQLDPADHGVLLDQVEERREPVHLVELPGEGGREVEAEAVDVHLGDPVPQRVHDQLEHVGVPHQQAVAGAGGVVVVRPVAVDQTVVGGVVDAPPPPEGQGGAQLVALGRVVVDHVEDDFETGRVQRLHHGLELVDLLAAGAEGGVGVVRGEEADGVVAPVVGQAAVLEHAVVHELVHRHEFHRGHAERGEVLQHGGVRESGVAAAQPFGDVRVGAGEAADMGLVDHRVRVRRPGRAVVAPVEERVGDHAQHGVAGAVRRGGPVRGRARTARGGCRSARPRHGRTGRAAASSGCSGGRGPAARGRAPGSRNAGRGRHPAGRRATRSRRPRAAGRGPRCRRRRPGSAPRARRPR